MNLSILAKIIRCGLAFHRWSAHRSDSYLWNPNIVAPNLATRHKLYSLRGRICEPREFDNGAPFRLLRGEGTLDGLEVSPVAITGLDSGLVAATCSFLSCLHFSER
jgi:hypothetical protein